MPDSLEDVIRRAIGYDLVPLSIRNHPEITREFRTAEDADGLVERISAALRADGWVKDREHIVQLDRRDKDAVIEFMQKPNGSFQLGLPYRLSVDAVEGGGVLIRTPGYRKR